MRVASGQQRVPTDIRTVLTSHPISPPAANDSPNPNMVFLTFYTTAFSGPEILHRKVSDFEPKVPWDKIS